ncbi:MAG: EAL domain-containing protein [Mycobacterium sp.]|nr:EAL domain-containing protein [Mycobacterium sp.]
MLAGVIARRRGRRPAIKGFQWRVAVFTVVLALACGNAAALWGVDNARIGAFVLQAMVGAGTLISAVVITAKVHGPARRWRLFVIAAFLSWMFGEILWWTAAGPSADGTLSAPPVAVAAYFLPPLFGLAAMITLVFAGRGVSVTLHGSVRHALLVTILDTLVAVLSFAILVLTAGIGGMTGIAGMTGVALPRSDDTAVVIAYSCVELVVVVTGVVMAMIYRPDRPYRTNYILLSIGIVTIAASDRMVAYLQNVGFQNGDLLGGIGFILGPLIIGFSLIRYPTSVTVRGRSEQAMDVAQLGLPYVGFLGIAALAAFHVSIGQPVRPPLIWTTLVMIFLVAARQAAAMRAQRMLTRRLYEVQERLAHQVHHDPLTGLPNRLLFAQRLESAVRGGRFVLIFVDLDDFKEVNDRYGHAAGDQLLCAVGERLQRCVGDQDTLARIGGDEFAILIDGELESPEVVADRIRVALRDPFAVHGSSVRVRASMGLVRPASDGPTPTSDDLLRQADTSMYAGKRLGKDTAVVYRPCSGLASDFPTVLRTANGARPPGFGLVYQPIVRLSDGTTAAVEALARWTAPNGTQIPPETFVGASEAAGLGAILDSLVLDLACREVAEAGLGVDLHVNIGAERLGNLSFERTVRDTLDRYALDPRRLVVEITETVPIVDLPEAADQIRRLGSVGIRVALDDFGAGYNSLTYIHALPVRIIKLDRSLAAGMGPVQNTTLYRSVIGLCEALGLEVIAEGIETSAQAQAAYLAGCQLAQGHLLGRPAPIGEFAAMSPVPTDTP